ncbi:MAG TPA: hypothetical protein VHO70_17695 [Chitinispirillaceae bacterium]|nr:hypothetical protein [Chitinispirillaceae bacterium]
MAITKKKKTPPKKNIQNEFHHQLINVLKAFDLLECWKRLTVEQQKMFTNNILRPMRHERDRAAGVESNVLAAMKADIKRVLDSELDLKALNTKIIFRDFMTAGLSLIGSIKGVIDEHNPDYAIWYSIHNALSDLVISLDFDNPAQIFSHFKTDLTYLCTKIDSWYYWFYQSKHEMTIKEPYCCLIYTLTREPAQKRYVTINGYSRPVFRLGCPSRLGVIWAEASALEIDKNMSATESYPVYVQAHALERCKERLKPLDRPAIQVAMYDAFDKNPEFSTGPDGARFVLFRYNEVKIGYLVYEIVDQMVIVKTFLLCTQNGTWEGNRLNKEYNLSKYIKKYFELDTLYTYIKTDVYKDKELKQIFSKCGCEGLFSIWNYEKQDSLTFDMEYAKNLKKIFLTN